MASVAFPAERERRTENEKKLTSWCFANQSSIRRSVRNF